jgi:hypothetical protein
LELLRTGWAVSAGTPFGAETIGERERAWAPVLEGRAPEAVLTGAPEAVDGTLVAWKDLLEQAEDSWLTWYHRGVARWFAGDETGAVAAWRESGDNPWALRNLALATGDLAAYERATELRPDLVPLVIEAATAALEVDAARAGRMLERAPGDDQRIRLLRVRYLLEVGEAAAAEALLDEGVEPSGVREGENPLAEYWQRAQVLLGTARPVPARYEFGMAGD